MTYEEKRAAKRAADLTEAILQPQEWRKDHKYRSLLLDPIAPIDETDEEYFSRIAKHAQERAAQEPAALEPGPPDYLDTEDPSEICHPVTGESEYD
jgi:hypothetical protein